MSLPKGSFRAGLQLCQMSVQLVFGNSFAAVELLNATPNFRVYGVAVSKSQRSCSSCVSTRRSRASSTLQEPVASTCFCSLACNTGSWIWIFIPAKFSTLTGFWEKRKTLRRGDLSFSRLSARTMTDRTKHEVMVCNDGAWWTLRLRRSDAGPIDLPEQYSAEPEAVDAARKFILARSKSHPTEVWFCLACEC